MSIRSKSHNDGQGVAWVALTIAFLVACVVGFAIGNVPAGVAFLVLAVMPAIPAQAYLRRRARRRGRSRP